MVRRHLKCWALPSMSSVWAARIFEWHKRFNISNFPMSQAFPMSFHLPCH
jgi:hypothetical protein